MHIENTFPFFTSPDIYVRVLAENLELNVESQNCKGLGVIPMSCEGSRM